MQKRTKITPEMIQAMKDMSAKGISSKVIADTLGIASSTTSNHLTKLGIVRRHPLSIPQEIVDEIHLRYKRGDPIRGIGTALRIGESTVRRHIESLPKRDPIKIKTPIVKSVEKQTEFAKNFKIHTPDHITVQKIKTNIPDYAPICAISTSAPYLGAELKYRK